jgi:hypothetical protein
MAEMSKRGEGDVHGDRTTLSPTEWSDIRERLATLWENFDSLKSADLSAQDKRLVDEK